jgi:hypothetical protein
MQVIEVDYNQFLVPGVIAGPPWLGCYEYGRLGNWPTTYHHRKPVRKPKMWPQNGGIKVNKKWSKLCNKELIQLFGDLDVLPFVRTSCLYWKRSYK